jgi:hypothetical protein
LLKYLLLPDSHGGSHRFESYSAHHIFNGLRATAKKPFPQIFHNSLDHLRGDSHLPEKRALSRPCLLPSQPALQIDDWELPQEFCLHTGSIPYRLLQEMLEHLPDGLRGEFLQAMLNTQPNTALVRDALLRGEAVRGAKLERGCHIRID